MALSAAHAQPPATDAPRRVELLFADEIEVIKGADGRETRYVRSLQGTPVQFRQETVYLYCNQAIQYPLENAVRATGQVRIVESDTVSLTGDSLYYDGNRKIAYIYGKSVVMQDLQRTLTTTYLVYHLNTGLASYPRNGTVRDAENTLVSRKGYYDTRAKIVSFKENVVYDHAQNGTHLETDTLTYHLQTKKVFFHAFTRVQSPDGLLLANEGEYDTEQRISDFRRQASIETPEYHLTGEHLYYDQKQKYGRAQGRVRMTNKADTITVYGDVGIYEGKNRRADVLGNALMERPFSGDTLFLQADTMVMRTDTVAQSRDIFAFPKVRLQSRSFQGRCDSLQYSMSDSVIRFFGKPVLWSAQNQITADSIWLTIQNQRPKQMFMRQNAFIISQDSLKYFDQIKGRNMVVQFRPSAYMQDVHVEGNGQSIYFALEGDTALVGMNKIDCSNMVMVFGDSNKLARIHFLVKPEGKIVPPHEIEQPETRLKGFQWRIDEKPDVREIHAQRLQYSLRHSRQNFGRQVVRQPYAVYLQGDTLTWIKEYVSELDLRGTFFVDIIPENPNDLPAKMRKQRYQRITFELGPKHLNANTLQYIQVLPKYPKYTIRLGQFVPGQPTDVQEAAPASPHYLWQEAFNLY